MLRFANKPDEIFLALLDDAITETLEVVLGFDDEPEEQEDAFKCHMPRSSALFTWQEAKSELAKLQKASIDECLYQITDYQWLLLYEALRSYCEAFQDMPWGDPYDKYGIEEIDFGWVIESFFWDTDFLMDDIPGLSLEQRQSLGVSSEAFGLTSGMKPHAEELAIKECTEKQNEQFEQTIGFYFTPGSKKYPSPPEYPVERSLPH